MVTVTATSTERKAPTRFRTPASSTAVFGLRAPVAIDVAMALPVSWNPLVKSNASAVTISSTRMIISALMGANSGATMANLTSLLATLSEASDL